MPMEESAKTFLQSLSANRQEQCTEEPEEPLSPLISRKRPWSQSSKLGEASHIFIFTPPSWRNDPILKKYFSVGLVQPPTSKSKMSRVKTHTWLCLCRGYCPLLIWVIRTHCDNQCRMASPKGWGMNHKHQTTSGNGWTSWIPLECIWSGRFATRLV